MKKKTIKAKINVPDTSVNNPSYTDTVPEAETLKNDKTLSLDDVLNEPEFEPEDSVIVDDDGVVTILTGPTALDRALNPEFSDNLAEYFDSDLLMDLAIDLIGKYEDDMEARQKRDRQYDEAMKRAGLDDEASPGGADFEGSSLVVHPMISKNCVDFSARSVKELCPPSGPVKSKIIGEATSKKIDESQRKVEFMNEVILNHMPYRSVLQSMLSQLPLGGSQFIKFWYDPYLKRPNCEFLPIDNVFIPFACNDFYSAERVTVRSDLNPVEYWRRVNEGIYYDPMYKEELAEQDDTQKMIGSTLGNSVNKIEFQSRTSRTNDKIEGKEEGANDDSFTILEIYTYLNLPEDDESGGEYAPYIVTIRMQDDELIGLYRNWSMNDKKKHKLDYIAKFDFIPWRGAYALSLGQLIGGMSAAATGALRALLDSAHVNNLPTALGLKGIKMAGQSPDIGIGRITFLEGPSGLEDDIKKCFMPLPFNPPSPTLFQLLEFLTAQADTVVKMPDGVVNSMGDRTPANTTLAMIEQGSTTQSAIHANLHFAQMKCFEIVSRLMRDHFDPDGYPDYLIEDLKINGALFQHTRDIVPVSDPNIFCEVQRYAQLEAVMNLAQTNQQAFNMPEIYKRALQLLKVPQPELLLNLPQAVCKSNAVAENAAALMGDQIQVYPDQNHLDHLFVHMAFLNDPIYGQNPAFNSNLVVMIEHIKEHLMYYYSQCYQQAVKNETGVAGFGIMNEDKAGGFDAQLQKLTPAVLKHIQDTLAPYMQEATQILQALGKMQQQQAQQSMNPEQIKLQIEQAKLQQAQAAAQSEQQKNQIASQESQARIQLDQAKMKNQQQTDSMKMQLEQMKAQSEIQIAQLQLQAEKEESESGVMIEKLRLEKERLESLEQIQLELLKHKNELEVESLKFGHDLGLKAAQHKAELKLDSEKHDKSLESAEKTAKSKPQVKQE